MHGSKLDLIVDKALDEDRKNYRQQDELNRIKLEEDRANLTQSSLRTRLSRTSHARMRLPLVHRPIYLRRQHAGL